MSNPTERHADTSGPPEPAGGDVVDFLIGQHHTIRDLIPTRDDRTAGLSLCVTPRCGGTHSSMLWLAVWPPVERRSVVIRLVAG
jgi:hypothetical protein